MSVNTLLPLWPSVFSLVSAVFVTAHYCFVIMSSVLWALAGFVIYLSITSVLLDSVTGNTACHHGDKGYPLGAQWTLPGYCRWFLCEENNQIVEKGCPDHELLEGCYMSEYDSSQTYPDCCPKLNCPDPEEIALQDWVDH